MRIGLDASSPPLRWNGRSPIIHAYIGRPIWALCLEAKQKTIVTTTETTMLGTTALEVRAKKEYAQ
jgi:hypothetical protein